MQFRIADTFTNSLTKLPNDVQKIIIKFKKIERKFGL